MAVVSVIIPTFNPGPHLGEALESVHRQTFTDFEVVVVDDGSEADLAPIIGEFPRVTLLRQANAGVSVARNRGVLASTAPLVAFMDQDDLWAPAKLERQVAVLADRADAGLCFCGLEVFSGEPPPSWFDNPADPVIETVLDPAALAPGESALARSVRFFADQFVVPSSTLIRRMCLAWTGMMDPWAPFTGDFDQLIRLGATTAVVRVHAVDVLYRVHQQNFTRQYDVGRSELTQMRVRYVAHAQRLGDRELELAAKESLRRPRRLYAYQAFDGARDSWRQRDLAGTAKHLGRSLTFHPAVVAEAVRQRVTSAEEPDQG